MRRRVKAKYGDKSATITAYRICSRSPVARPVLPFTRIVDKSGHKTSITETCTRYEALGVVMAMEKETQIV
jgi:hypothetical protein